MPKRRRVDDTVAESREMEPLPASKVRKIYDHVGEQLQRIRRKSDSDVVSCLAGKRKELSERYAMGGISINKEFANRNEDRTLKANNVDSCHDLLEKIFTFKTKTVLQYANFFMRNETEPGKTDDDNGHVTNECDDDDVSNLNLKKEPPSPVKTTPLVFGKGSNMYNPIVIFDGARVDFEHDGVVYEEKQEEKIDIINLDETLENSTIPTNLIKIVKVENTKSESEITEPVEEHKAIEKPISVLSVTLVGGKRHVKTCMPCSSTEGIDENTDHDVVMKPTESNSNTDPQNNVAVSTGEELSEMGRTKEQAGAKTVDTIDIHTSRKFGKLLSNNGHNTYAISTNDKGKLKKGKSYLKQNGRSLNNTRHVRKDNDITTERGKENENVTKQKRGKRSETKSVYSSSYKFTAERNRKSVKVNCKNRTSISENVHDESLDDITRHDGYRSDTSRYGHTHEPFPGGKHKQYTPAEENYHVDKEISSRYISTHENHQVHNEIHRRYKSTHENYQVNNGPSSRYTRGHYAGNKVYRPYISQYGNFPVNREVHKQYRPTRGHFPVDEDMHRQYKSARGHLPDDRYAPRPSYRRDYSRHALCPRERFSRRDCLQIQWDPLCCYVCKSHFRSHHDFFKHIRKFNHCPFSIVDKRAVDVYVCGYCPYDTKSWFKMMHHYKVTHCLYFRQQEAKSVMVQAILR